MKKLIVAKPGEWLDMMPGVAYYMPDGKILSVCAACGSVIQLNKRIFGDLHLCINPDESANAKRS